MSKLVRTKTGPHPWVTEPEEGGGGGGGDLSEVLANGNDAGAQQIRHLADGTDGDDAATVNNIGEALQFVGLNAVLSTDPDAGGIKIKNIGDAVDPNDAVSFQQLHARDTFQVTTDPDSPFNVERNIDFVTPCLYTVTFTLISADGDGETFGDQPGDVYVDVAQTGSWDGIVYQANTSVMQPFTSNTDTGGLTTPGDQVKVGAGVPRFLKLVLSIFDLDSFSPYAGANHPTATVEVAYSTIQF